MASQHPIFPRIFRVLSIACLVASPADAAFGLQGIRRARLTAPAAPRLAVTRSSPLRALAGDNDNANKSSLVFTSGDYLVSVAQTQLNELSAERNRWRAEINMDAILDAGNSDLDKSMRLLDKSLDRLSANASKALRDGMQRTEVVFLKRYNETTQKLDTVLEPSRQTIRAELARHFAERDEQLRAVALRNANACSYARSKRAMEEQMAFMGALAGTPGRTDPIALGCHVSSIGLNLLLGLVVVARVSELKGTCLPLLAEPSVHAMAAHTWWMALGADLAVYLVTVTMLIAREWSAIGASSTPSVATAGAQAVPNTADPSTSSSLPYSELGFIRWEFDWERDEWKEVRVLHQQNGDDDVAKGDFRA